MPSDLEAIETQQALARTVGLLSATGLQVLALDGAPDYALPSGHGDLFRMVGEVAAYNNAVTGAERLDGLHLDIEPYLLPQWSDEREETVVSFLLTLDALRERTEEADLLLEVAVPFWFDSVPLRRPRGDRIESSTLVDAVLERIDSIAVMDYRTTVDGSNGVLALAESELAAAAEHGRDVWIGLETTRLPDQSYLRFRGEGKPGLPDAGEAEWWIVALPDVLIAVPGDALSEVHERAADMDERRIRHWAAYSVEVPASRQTFHDLGFRRLEEVMQETERRLIGHPAYAGLALHYERSLRRLLDLDPEGS